jgi:peptide/nickel transport system ATP-binding protein
MAGTGKAHLRPERNPLLTVEDLVVEFPVSRNEVVHAVSGISFDMVEGETLGLVGESGSGKSTTGRAVVQLPPPTSGSVVLDGVDLADLEGERLRRMRPQLQMILQDSIASLNPRRTVFDLVARGLRIWGRQSDQEIEVKVQEMLEAVGLAPEAVRDRRPHQFSGGQCQRICIARALIVDPRIVICDEPVSALDVSVQAQILNVLEAMKQRYGLTLLFISHDLGVVKNISDRVAVMYLGRLCEVGAPDVIYAHPAHHYTKLLIESIPDMRAAEHTEHDEDATLQELPSPIDPPSGCRFRTRCPAAQERCAREVPELTAVGPDHFVACHFPLERPVRAGDMPVSVAGPAGVR